MLDINVCLILCNVLIFLTCERVPGGRVSGLRGAPGQGSTQITWFTFGHPTRRCNKNSTHHLQMCIWFPRKVSESVGMGSWVGLGGLLGGLGRSLGGEP